MGMFDDLVPQQPGSQSAPAATPPAPAARGMFDDLIPKVSTLSDVAKSAGVGVGKGIIGTLTAARDLPDLASYVLTYPLVYGAEKAGWLPPGKTTADFYAEAERLGKDMPREPLDIPTSREVQKGVEQFTGPFYEPKTMAGKFAKTGSEFTTSAALTGPRSLGALARSGLIPGLASEAAGQLTEGSAAEPWLRAAAGVGTGVGLSLATRPSVDARMVSRATRGATDADIQQATALMSDAAMRGVRLTWPEAMQQVTNGGTMAGRLQRLVEGTNEGGSVMAPAMAQRPGQIAGAVNQQLDRIAPQTMPTRTAIRARTAADDHIGQVRNDINAAEQPYYDAANMRSVPPQDLRFISQDPAFQQALQNVRNDAIRGKDIANYNANDVPTLIAVRKEMARMEENALSPGMAGNPDRELARNITPVRQRLDQIITQHAPEYGQALGVGAGLRAQRLAPELAGPVGQVASTDDIAKQLQALFPVKPMEGTAQETSNAIRSISAYDPAAAAGLARQHIASNFAESAQNNVAGQNQWGGAKFAADLAGNPLQREVLRRNLEALPNGRQIAEDMERMLAAFEATGKRQPPGSPTAQYTADLKDAGASGAVGAGLDVLRTLNPAALLKRLQDGIDRARLGTRSENVARGMLADPEEAAALIRRAREQAPEGRNLTELLRLIGSNNSVFRLPAQ